jgi:putative intracellular protease/amidase
MTATTNDRAVWLLVFDGLADWEPSFALTGLRRWAKVPVRTVGFAASPVTTMGGLRLLPDLALADLDLDRVSLFVLPGGEMWEADGDRASIEPVVHGLVSRRVPVAAICAATLALARSGLLKDRRHTSNGREYLLNHAPRYSGAEHYEETLAIRDRGIITASGLGAVEFAREIFEELQVFGADELAMFHEMYRHGRLPLPTA